MIGQLDPWVDKLVRKDEVFVDQSREGSADASHLDVGGRHRLYHQEQTQTSEHEHTRTIGGFLPLTKCNCGRCSTTPHSHSGGCRCLLVC